MPPMSYAGYVPAHTGTGAICVEATSGHKGRFPIIIIMPMALIYHVHE